MKIWTQGQQPHQGAYEHIVIVQNLELKCNKFLILCKK